MSTYLRTRPAWLQLVIFGALTGGLFLLCSTVGLALVAQTNGLSIMQIPQNVGDLAKPEMAGVARGLLIVQFFGLFLLPSLIFAYLADPRPLAFSGLRMPDKKSFIGWGILIIIAAFFMVEWLSEINQNLVSSLLGKSARQWVEQGETETDNLLKNILTMNKPVELLRSILLVGVMAAIGEELFFRGIMQRILIQAFNSPWPGIILTAAIFSAFHGQFMGFIPRMILGIILGALYWYSGSIIPAMAGHFIYNSGQLVLVYLKIADTDSPKPGTDKSVMWFGILALVVVVFLLNYIRKKSTTTLESFYGSEEPQLPDDPSSV
ncbi:MAG TPA: type II CAAX endopeptidase family protein [Puia sp.]|nr:type II CAAX endopeptidase family protein [Puia sp.]